MYVCVCVRSRKCKKTKQSAIKKQQSLFLCLREDCLIILNETLYSMGSPVSETGVGIPF